VALGIKSAESNIKIIPTTFNNNLIPIVTKVSGEFASLVSKIPEWISRGDEYDSMLSVLNEVITLDERKFGQHRTGVGISSGLIGAVLWSIYSFLSHPYNYIKCIALAYWPGGDVDTTAAMAGALSGAVVGFYKLKPFDIIPTLEDYKNTEWTPLKLHALVVQCYNCWAAGILQYSACYDKETTINPMIKL